MDKLSRVRLLMTSCAAGALAACGGGGGDAMPSSAVGSAAGGSTRAVAAAEPGEVVWTQCAIEEQVCSFTGTKEARYGYNGVYATATFTNRVICGNNAFGDPAPGRDKVCEIVLDTAAPAPAPAPAPGPAPEAWTFCANERGVCTFTGTQLVRFGATGAYVTALHTGSVACDNRVFGDPAYGVEKHCDVAPAPEGPPPPAPAPSPWTQCAFEDQTCSFVGTKQVRYGYNGTYATGTFTNGVMCGNGAFGDPAPGRDKVCEISNEELPPPPPPAPDPNGVTWAFCGIERSTCNLTGTQLVRFGANGVFVTGTFTGMVACDNSIFGDPAYGVEKHCEIGTPNSIPEPSPGSVVPGVWVAMGSSTAEGTGTSVPVTAWTARLQADVYAKGVTLNNLALSGATTYTGLPTSTPAVPDRPAPNGAYNIEAALAFSPKLVIIAYPTNDTSNDYTVSETVNNLLAIRAAALAQGVPVIVQGTQPRDLTEEQLALLPQIDEQLAGAIGPCFVEVRSALQGPTGQIRSIYSTGDGTHLNDAGHELIFNRIKSVLTSGQCVPTF